MGDDTVTCANSLAGTLYALNDWKGAKSLYERILSSCECVCGVRHPNTLSTQHNIGLVCSALGEEEIARKMLSRANNGFEKILGASHMHSLHRPCWVRGVIKILKKKRLSVPIIQILLQPQKNIEIEGSVYR